MNKNAEVYLKQVLDHYLTSRDFNGLPLDLEDLKKLRDEIKVLVQNDKIYLGNKSNDSSYYLNNWDIIN